MQARVRGVSRKYVNVTLKPHRSAVSRYPALGKGAQTVVI